MSKSKGLQYTAGEKQVIDSSWFTLMRAVERSSTQEKRLEAAVKSDAKEFGQTSARALIIESVLRGLKADSIVAIRNAMIERDEKLMAFAVGVWLGAERAFLPEGPAVLITSLEQARTAWKSAHDRYLEGL